MEAKINNKLKSQDIVVLPQWTPMFLRQAMENIYTTLLTMEDKEYEEQN